MQFITQDGETWNRLPSNPRENFVSQELFRTFCKVMKRNQEINDYFVDIVNEGIIFLS